ncbi:hypothetical protein XH98_13800 [Bradyrhizobium sp. CCBAU 51745]|uniref:hypothetical protein n=1 Tax=Bradyrhizobium sp. CCBAU 51745 TaxID=1325099 RepID=UPI002305530F|nr:hypothetical protein [Bradyrhizobium sp. CCBAU 51745]MDA9440181.1 hypothetical protein [Bradyrhizobium sp. CCBAU 51745]
MKPMLSERKNVSPDEGVSDPVTPMPPRPGAMETAAPKRTRIRPTVSWYGKILIIGALLMTFGWELFHFVITLLTLD